MKRNKAKKSICNGSQNIFCFRFLYRKKNFSTERECCLYPGYDGFQKQILKDHCNLQENKSAVSHAKSDPCVPAQAQMMTYHWQLPTAALLGIATSGM